MDAADTCSVMAREINDVKQNTKTQLHGKLLRQLTELTRLPWSLERWPRSLLSISVKNSAAVDSGFFGLKRTTRTKLNQTGMTQKTNLSFIKWT